MTTRIAAVEAEPKREGEALLVEARRVFRSEADALVLLADRIGDDFIRAIELLRRAEGRIIVSGIGKSGIIGRKIAATLTSTGTPATFLHPVEGLHGDLGIVSRQDVAILISKSGETNEITGLVDFFLRLGVPIVVLTGRMDSPLARHATVALDCSVVEEACPMDLAPTTSTTAALAMGDALAVVLLQTKGFEREDFARLHPGGQLGRKLTVRVADVMVREAYPSLGKDATMRECIVPLGLMRGTIPIVDADDRVIGVVTSGDLTRLMEREPDSFLAHSVGDVMTSSPKLAREDQLGAAALHTMEAFGIMALPVVDEGGFLRGVVHLHDLMRSGVV